MADYPNPWLYKTREFEENEIAENVGFVYMITGPDGRRYLGQKRFVFSRLRKRKKSRNQRVKVESDWREYWGSSRALQEDIARLGEEHFRREILVLCKTKGDLHYEEVRQIILHDALRSDLYYNEYIRARISSKHLSKKSVD